MSNVSYFSRIAIHDHYSLCTGIVVGCGAVTCWWVLFGGGVGVALVQSLFFPLPVRMVGAVCAGAVGVVTGRWLCGAGAVTGFCFCVLVTIKKGTRTSFCLCFVGDYVAIVVIHRIITLSI